MLRGIVVRSERASIQVIRTTKGARLPRLRQFLSYCVLTSDLFTVRIVLPAVDFTTNTKLKFLLFHATQFFFLFVFFNILSM